MAIVTKSIKATGGDYTDPASWEADLDNTTPYDAGDHAFGELYDEQYDVSAITFNGGATIGLASVRLTVESTQRHDGTAGTGARLRYTGSVTTPIGMVPCAAGAEVLIFEFFEVNGNGQAVTGYVFNAGAATASRVPVIRNVLCHDFTTTSANSGFVGNNTRDVRVQNSIFYDFACSANRSAIGLFLDCDEAEGGCLNVTIYKIAGGTNLGQTGTGFKAGTNDTDGRIRNTISVGHTGFAAACFDYNTFTNLTSSNNLSDDISADNAGGTGHVEGATVANMFVSTTDGSEDLAPQDADAPQVDAGADLGTTPTGVNIDARGRDRDAEADTWDIGATEFVAAGGGTDIPVAAGALTLAGQAPALVLALGIAAGTLAFTGYAPVVDIGATVTPAAGTLVLSGQAPSLQQTLNVARAQLTLAGQAPATQSQLPVAAAAVAFAGHAPAAQNQVAVAAGALAFTGYAPTVDEGVSGTTIPIAAGALALAGQSLALQQTVAVDVGALLATGQQPSLGEQVAVAAGTLTLVGYAPSLAAQGQIPIDAGAATLTGYAPTLVLREVIAVAAGSLAFDGSTAALQDLVAIAAAAATITGYAPTVHVAQAVDVAAGSLALTGYAPAVDVTVRTIAVGAGALSFAGYAAALQDQLALPAGALAFSGYVPNVTQATLRAATAITGTQVTSTALTGTYVATTALTGSVEGQ